MWGTYGNGPVHVMPVSDLVEHLRSTACPCGPEVIEDGRVIVHHAYDCREIAEKLAEYGGEWRDVN